MPSRHDPLSQSASASHDWLVCLIPVGPSSGAPPVPDVAVDVLTELVAPPDPVAVLETAELAALEAGVSSEPQAPAIISPSPKPSTLRQRVTS